MIPKICAIGLISALLAALLGEMGFKNKKLLSLFAILLLLGTMNDGIAVIVGKILPLADSVGISEACKCALKAVGLGYLFGFTSDVCAELGEMGVSKAVSVVGRVEIILVVLPYFEKTIELGTKLLK